MFEGKKTYGEFLNSDEKIATNILADRLFTLECAGLIKSKTDNQKKSRILYSLTEKGIDLVPVLLEIIKWSANYDMKSGAPKEFVDRIKKDKENLSKEIVSKLKSGKSFF
jgi:DNA-binding HxlR family transcriptional regulator